MDQRAAPGTWPEELLLAPHHRVFLDTTGGTVGLVTGQVDAYLIAGPPQGHEDVAPLPVGINEAGGRVTDLNRASALTGDGTVLATNGLLHNDFLDLMAHLPRSRD